LLGFGSFGFGRQGSSPRSRSLALRGSLRGKLIHSKLRTFSTTSLRPRPQRPRCV